MQHKPKQINRNLRRREFMNFNSKNIIEQDTFSYFLYKELTDDFLYKDNRELNYQNRVIIPMLEKYLRVINQLML